MTQDTAKSIKTDKTPKQAKTGLEKLPEVKQEQRQPKIVKASETKRKRSRAGHLSIGVSPFRKPKQERNGAKIK